MLFTRGLFFALLLAASPSFGQNQLIQLKFGSSDDFQYRDSARVTSQAFHVFDADSIDIIIANSDTIDVDSIQVLKTIDTQVNGIVPTATILAGSLPATSYNSNIPTVTRIRLGSTVTWGGHVALKLYHGYSGNHDAPTKVSPLGKTTTYTYKVFVKKYRN
jgi:hypothetical protein